MQLFLSLYCCLAESGGGPAGVVRQPDGRTQTKGERVRGADRRAQRQDARAQTGEGQRGRCPPR